MAKNVTQTQINNLLGIFGSILAFVLLAAAAGAWVGHNFATAQVHNQLVQEKISFPAAGSPGLDPKEFPGLQKYGGQPVDTGAKAKAYADEFIWEHMMKASAGKTYAEVSTLAQASPKDTKLAGLKSTLFQGDMLRSSLLTAYAFSVLGMLAGYAAPALLLVALLVLALSILSFTKARK